MPEKQSIETRRGMIHLRTRRGKESETFEAITSKERTFLLTLNRMGVCSCGSTKGEMDGSRGEVLQGTLDLIVLKPLKRRLRPSFRFREQLFRPSASDVYLAFVVLREPIWRRSIPLFQAQQCDRASLVEMEQTSETCDTLCRCRCRAAVQASMVFRTISRACLAALRLARSHPFSFS